MVIINLQSLPKKLQVDYLKVRDYIVQLIFILPLIQTVLFFHTNHLIFKNPLTENCKNLLETVGYESYEDLLVNGDITAWVRDPFERLLTAIIEETKDDYDLLIVDFHGEITSEKNAIGHFF